MTWQIPWVIAGVDEVPLSTVRTMAYVTTAGRTGVIASDHLKVTATGTPSGSIEVAPGVFVTLNKFIGASFESYVGRNWSSSVTTTVPATGATSRTDLVYAHITDPGQAGHYPSEPTVAAPVETRIITNVSPTITQLQEHPGYENQSGIALARITRPANSTTVQNSHITDLRVLLESAISPIGQVSMFAGNTVPYGWIFCQGQAVSRTTYAALFATIGTTYGAGDSINTFNVPDFRGRTGIGAGTGDASGATAHALGAKKGKETHALTVPEMPGHTHGITDPGHTHTQTLGGAITTVAPSGGSGVIGVENNSLVSSSATGISVQSTGGSLAHSILSPSTVVNYIIKAY